MKKSDSSNEIQKEHFFFVLYISNSKFNAEMHVNYYSKHSKKIIQMFNSKTQVPFLAI